MTETGDCHERSKKCGHLLVAKEMKDCHSGLYNIIAYYLNVTRFQKADIQSATGIAKNVV